MIITIIDMARNYDLQNTGPEVQQRLDTVPANTEGILAERTRAEIAEQNLDDRLRTVEELAQIMIDGGVAGIASPQDFVNPTPAQKAKIPTVGAIMDGPGINVHLTEDQYDALTEEERMNGSWYFIEE